MYTYKSEPFTIILYCVDRNIHFQEAIYFKTLTGTHFWEQITYPKGDDMRFQNVFFSNKLRLVELKEFLWNNHLLFQVIS